jgi:hypothetical protein
MKYNPTGVRAFVDKVLPGPVIGKWFLIGALRAVTTDMEVSRVSASRERA